MVTEIDHRSLAGKVAVISGGTRGLGEATARLFAARGAAGLVLAGRGADAGEELARELGADGCPTSFVRADVSEVGACRRIIATAVERHGTLQVLVNVAALTDRGSIWDTTPELFDRMLAVNVRAPFFLIQEAIGVMAAGGGGSIVNVSSVAAHGATPFLTPYAVSKGALNVLTRNVAYSVMRHNIRVNALSPGWMDTASEDAIQKRYHSADDAWLGHAEAAAPFGRLLKPDEIARAIAYLASDESGMMTGAVVDFDQSVLGAGNAPSPPPIETWPVVAGVSYGPS